MNLDRRIFKLKGVVQHYSWGGFDFIPQLLNIENKDRKPFAEYWMGAHANYPALIENEIPLNHFIEKNVEEVLGRAVAEKFSSLPYLLKVLDVRQMLSIQVHPSKQAAEICFEEENKKGIPVNAPNRNYKDKNHKPELMVALSDFYLLHGFKSQAELQRVLDTKEELHFLKEIFLHKGYKGLYEEVMLMEQKRVNEILDPLLQKILPAYQDGTLKRDNEDFWAARAAINFCRDNNYDRGIFSVYLFNLVYLKKGEGIFQQEGMPHAYLEGQNVEVMANSDNVLRAGLTDKHIDVTELLKHVKFEVTYPNILNPNFPFGNFISPAEEFDLHQLFIKQGENISIKTKTAETFLVMDGSITVGSGSEQMQFKKGESFIVTSNTQFMAKALAESELFRVTVPCE
jgi:mannose-6-phosphate isomerase